MDPAKGGIKHDGDKTQWHLLPLEAVEGAVRVMMHGAKKYSKYNWANGMPYSRVLDAALRHINSIYQGEDKDPDSGLDHVDHAICELLFLKYYMIHNVGEDDRFKRPEQPNAPITVTRLLAGFGPQWTNTGVVTSTPTQSVAYNVPAADRLDYIKRMITQYDTVGDLTHEDIEGDKNYWGV